MEQTFFALDIDKAIQDVFQYGHQLLENPIGSVTEKTSQELLGEYITNHRFTLSSFNWIYNLGINKIYEEEFERSGFKRDVWSWYAGLNIILNYWLERMECWVIVNKQYQIIDTVNLLMAFDKNLTGHTEVGKDISMLISAIQSGHVENFFSKTISALEKAYQEDIQYCPFIQDKNINNEGVKLPITFVIDPFYLTITFIH